MKPGKLSSRDQTLLYGLGSEACVAVPGCEAVLLHALVVEPFTALAQSASREGIDLRIASGQRGFERQLSIWNRKASGQLRVFGNDGLPIDLAQLTELEQVFAIMRWSALPGASRHHWGTDLDVFDAQDLPDDYQLLLTVEESRVMFGRLHTWLDEQIEQNTAMGFIRPYQQDRGGVAQEPWHLSYAPLAEVFQRAFSIDQLASILAESDIALKAAILANLEEIHQRFIELPYSIYPAKRV
jgi:LAS superfamily LD-carboxypeptidase LdcB